MKIRFDQVEQIGEEITKQSLESLASFVRTDLAQRAFDNLPSIGEAQSAIVVFNPSSTARTDIVSATIELPPNCTEFDLVTENGASLPYQEHGLGSHEIINMTLDPRGLQSAFANIADGHAAGMNIQDIKVRRSGAEVFIETFMADRRRTQSRCLEYQAERNRRCISQTLPSAPIMYAPVPLLPRSSLCQCRTSRVLATGLYGCAPAAIKKSLPSNSAC